MRLRPVNSEEALRIGLSTPRRAKLKAISPEEASALGLATPDTSGYDPGYEEAPYRYDPPKVTTAIPPDKPGAFESFTSGLVKAPLSMATSVKSLFDPEAGLRDQQNIEAALPSPGVSGFAGQAIGSILPTALAVAAPPLAVPVMAGYALSGAGSGREVVEGLQQRGVDIGWLKEAATAAGFAASEIVPETIALKRFAALAVRKFGKEVGEQIAQEVAEKGIKTVAKGLGIEATQEAATQVGQSGIEAGLDPNKDFLSPETAKEVGLAAAGGAIGGAALGGGINLANRYGQQAPQRPQTSPPSPSADVPRGTPQVPLQPSGDVADVTLGEEVKRGEVQPGDDLEAQDALARLRELRTEKPKTPKETKSGGEWQKYKGDKPPQWEIKSALRDAGSSETTIERNGKKWRVWESGSNYGADEVVDAPVSQPPPKPVRARKVAAVPAEAKVIDSQKPKSEPQTPLSSTGEPQQVRTTVSETNRQGIYSVPKRLKRRIVAAGGKIKAEGRAYVTFETPDGFSPELAGAGISFPQSLLSKNPFVSKKTEGKAGKKLMTVRGISDFNPNVDKVVRRGDRTFVVKEHYADQEVVSDLITPEVESNIRQLPTERLSTNRQLTKFDASLSREGRDERLAIFDDEMAKRRPQSETDEQKRERLLGRKVTPAPVAKEAKGEAWMTAVDPVSRYLQRVVKNVSEAKDNDAVRKVIEKANKVRKAPTHDVPDALWRDVLREAETQRIIDQGFNRFEAEAIIAGREGKPIKPIKVDVTTLQPKYAPPAAPAKPKEAWEMTSMEFYRSPLAKSIVGKPIQGAIYSGSAKPSAAGRNKWFTDQSNKAHRSAVEQALASGKPVPAEVLADYPDLAPKQKAEVKEATSTKVLNPTQDIKLRDGEKLFHIYTKGYGDNTGFERVAAKDFKLPFLKGFDLFIRKVGKDWQISEVSTGSMLGSGGTIERATMDVKFGLEQFGGVKKMREKIDTLPKAPSPSSDVDELKADGEAGFLDVGFMETPVARARDAFEVTKRILTTVEARLRASGKYGNKLADMLVEIDFDENRYLGDAMTELHDLKAKISKEDFPFISGVVDKKFSSPKSDEIANKPEVQAFVKAWHKVTNTIFYRAKSMGVKILVKGKWVPIDDHYIPSYIRHELTPKAREELGLDGKARAETVDHLIDTKQAKNEEDALGLISEWLKYDPTRVTYGSLQRPRLADLPADMYEQNFVKLLPSMLKRSAHFLAVFKQFGHAGSKVKPVLAGIATESPDLYNYAVKVVELETNGEPSTPGSRLLRSGIGVSANIGLSSPTSGLKNWMLGDVKDFQHFGIRRYMTGYKDLVLNYKKSYDLAMRVSAIESGTHDIEASAIAKWSPGLMHPSERANRIKSVARAVAYARDALGILNNKPVPTWESVAMGNFKPKLHARHVLEDVFRFGNVDQIIKRGHFTEREILRIAYFGQAQAQGTTTVRSMPLWMNNRYGKSAALFYRMAYRATSDVWQNAVKPASKGNLSPLLFFVAGSALSGELLYQLAKLLYGVAHPKDDDPIWERLWADLIHGEGMALLSNYMEGYGSIWETYMPVLLNNALTVASTIGNVVTGKKFPADAGKDALRSMVALYNTTRRTIRARNPHTADFDLARREVRKWQKENKKSASFDIDLTERSPFYRHVRESIEGGESDDIKSSVRAAVDYLMLKEGLKKKEAHSILSRTITSSSPVPLGEDRQKAFMKSLNTENQARVKNALSHWKPSKLTAMKELNRLTGESQATQSPKLRSFSN